MMNSSVHQATGSTTDPTSAFGADDDTVATPPRGGGSNSRERLCVEKTLKFRFVPSEANDGVHPAILHVHWMNEVQSTFGNDVQFFDNRNRQVTKFEPLRTDPAKHIQQFQLLFDRRTQHRVTNSKKANQATPDPRRVTSHIVHRIRTSIPLSEIKATFSVMKLMNDHNFYVNEHRWSETDWETTQLGFIYGIDPQFHDIDQATNQVMKNIQQNNPRVKIPKFRLVYCSPKMLNAKGRSIRTKAYAIETLRDDRDSLTQVLKNAYKESGVFISFQMRNRHPEAFERIIKAQTQMISTNYVVVINNLGPDAMHYLSDRITAIDGVLSLLPCKSVNEDGKYKVLVHQKNYHRVRQYLKDVIPQWYEDYVEPDAKAPEGRYPGKPEVSQTDSDGYSQGDNSYMNISINTAMSLGSAISNDTSPPSYVYQREKNESPDASTIDTSTLGDSRTHSSGHQRSWADAVKKSHARSFQNESVVSPHDTQNALKEDLENSRAEVAALKEKLVQMERDSEKAREMMEEKVKHQVDQALKVQFEAFAKEMTFQFAQMMMSQQSGNAKPAIKRSAIELQEDNDIPLSQMHIQRDNAAKRINDNKSPHKPLNFPGVYNENAERCQTPPFEERQLIMTPWTGTPFTPQSNTSRSESKPDNGNPTTTEKQVSQSEDSDSIQHGFGNESTNKSPDDQMMEIEAHGGENVDF